MKKIYCGMGTDMSMRRVDLNNFYAKHPILNPPFSPSLSDESEIFDLAINMSNRRLIITAYQIPCRLLFSVLELLEDNRMFLCNDCKKPIVEPSSIRQWYCDDCKHKRKLQADSVWRKERHGEI